MTTWNKQPPALSNLYEILPMIFTIIWHFCIKWPPVLSDQQPHSFWKCFTYNNHK